MRLDHIAGMAFNQLLGRLLRRAALAIVIAVCALVALYHFTAAGSIALQAQYGLLNATLIIGGIYSALALGGAAVLWATRSKPDAPATPALAGQREMQLVMLVEAVMLGYALARKTPRAS